MSDDVERIKRSLSTERLIKSRASDWSDESGGDRVGRCTHPEHGHSSDSSNAGNLIVTEDGGWYCYSHETGGGLFEWVAVQEGIVSCSDLRSGLSDGEFSDALEAAAGIANIDLSDAPDGSTTASGRKAKAIGAMETATEILSERLHKKIVSGQSMFHHVKQTRGFDAETIAEARVGYLDGQAQADLQRALSQDQLKDIGLLRENGNWHVNERIIYPYFVGGAPVYWIGRRTERSEMGAKYLKPSSTTCVFDQPLYTADSFTRGRDDTLYVVEGIQDALSVAQQGHAACAPVATNPSETQTTQLAEVATEYADVTVCYDWDESGAGRGLELAEQLMRRGTDTQVGTLADPDAYEGVGDPNDLLVAGGHIDDDVAAVATAERILDVRGDGEDVVEDLLATVEPDTPRADRLVDRIARDTPYRKRTLRKLCKKTYRRESQSGWIEPDRVQKTDGTNPLWTFLFPSGEKITLTTEELSDGPTTFCARYMELFNYLPDFKQDEWKEQVNTWLASVEVVDPSPLTEEGQVREEVLGSLERTNTFPTLRRAVTNGGAVKWEPGDDTAMVPKHTLVNWIDDLEVSLRVVADYLEPYLAHSSTRVRPKGKGRLRVWHFDVDAVEDAGYQLETPRSDLTAEAEKHRLPDPDESDDDGETDADAGDDAGDGDDDDDDFDLGGGVDHGDGPATDGGYDIAGRREHPPDSSLKLHGPPGTGKSQQLLERITALLDGGYGVDDIAFITYRKEMAADFLRRLSERGYISEQAALEPWDHGTRFWGTLHAVCNRMDRRNRDVATTADKRDFCQSRYNVGFGGDAPSDDAPDADDRGSLMFGLRSWWFENLKPAKTREWHSSGDVNDAWPHRPSVAEFAAAWSDYKDDHGLYDFADMLWDTYADGRTPPCSIVVVDEYHDFTPLMDALANQFMDAADIQIAAGDPLQAIYSYKGADPDLFIDLELPEVLLDRTWRVPRRVWKYAAETVLSHDAPPVTPDTTGGTIDVTTRTAPGHVDQYGGDDILFLARTKSVARDISSQLSDAGIVHRSQSNLGGWNDASMRLELYNALAKLDGAKAPGGLSASGQSGFGYFEDTHDGDRVASSIPLTNAELTRLVQKLPAEYCDGYKKHVRSWAANAGDITADELIDHVKPGFWTDLTRGAESVDALLSYDGNPYIDAALDRNGRPYPEISLAPVPDVMTIHASKGMEADTVVLYDGITGAISDAIFGDDDRFLGETRVWYVGATRTSNRLVVNPPGAWTYLDPYLTANVSSAGGDTGGEPADD